MLEMLNVSLCLSADEWIDDTMENEMPNRVSYNLYPVHYSILSFVLRLIDQFFPQDSIKA